MRKAILFMLTALALALTAPAAKAEIKFENAEAVLARIDELEKELAELKAFVASQTGGKVEAPPMAAEKGVEISGKTYLAYTFDSDGADKSDNEFTVDRWYFTVKKKVDPKISLNFTTDAATSPDSSKTKFNLFIKYANVQFNDAAFGGDLVFGQQAGSWNGNEEKAWKYRSVRKVLADDKGLLNSSDFGLGLKGKIADGAGDCHILFSNGEGYGSREETGNANGKDVAARVSLQLGPSAPRLSLYGDVGSKNNDNSNRLAVMLNQQVEAFSYGLSFIGATDAAIKKRGWSAFANYDIEGGKWAVLGRFDRYDPDRSASADAQTLALGGLARRLNKDSRVTLTYHQDKDRALAGTGGEKDAMIKAVVEVDY